MSYGLDLAYNKPKKDLNVQFLKRSLLYLDTATRELAMKISEHILTHECNEELLFEFMTLLYWCSDRAWHAVSQHIQILDEAGFQPTYARPDMALLGYMIDFRTLGERFGALFPEIAKLTTSLLGVKHNPFQLHIKGIGKNLENYCSALGLSVEDEKFEDYKEVVKLGIFIREYTCPSCGKGFAVRSSQEKRVCEKCGSKLLPKRWQLYPSPTAPVWNYAEPPKIYLEELEAQGLKFKREMVKPPFPDCDKKF